MPYTIKQAARAFNRVWGPIAEARAEWAQADAGFDGGEFSSGFHDMAYGTHKFKVLKVVATKMQVDRADILIEISRQEHEYQPGRDY